MKKWELKSKNNNPRIKGAPTPPRGFKFKRIMSTKLKFKNETLRIASPKDELVIAEQEKALAKQEFELARTRLMRTTRRVQDLKVQCYYRKEASHV